MRIPRIPKWVFIVGNGGWGFSSPLDSHGDSHNRGEWGSSSAQTGRVPWARNLCGNSVWESWVCGSLNMWKSIRESDGVGSEDFGPGVSRHHSDAFVLQNICGIYRFPNGIYGPWIPKGKEIYGFPRGICGFPRGIYGFPRAFYGFPGRPGTYNC